MDGSIKLCERCEGCGLCSNICPQDAIALVQNEKGFYVPKIDTEKCVACGLCMKAIGLKTRNAVKSLDTYIAKTKSQEVLMRSSSGGVFTGISDAVLSEGGVVYGVAFGPGFRVTHTRATTQTERNAMRGSKYVQSIIGDCFRGVRADLEEGKPVLFTGTPCQVDALNIYLQMRHVCAESLITCEVICNGASSPGLWQRYVEEYLGKETIEDISFRYKHPKINGSIFAVTKKNGSIDASGYYSQLYTSKNCYADACYHCRYASKNRCADLSIGDFQGKVQEEIRIEKNGGCSVVLINTEKGRRCWERTQSQFSFQRLVAEYEQERMTSPCKQPETYKRFWEDAGRLTMRKLLNKYTAKSLLEDIRCMRFGRSLKD